MPPSLALLLCACFVLFLLRSDIKQRPGVSAATWIPTVWMLICASKPLGTWLGSAGDRESGSAVDRLVLSGLLAAALILLVRRRFNWSRTFRNNAWLMSLLAYMLLSVLWSDIPGVSFKRWIRELGSVVMAFLLITEEDPQQAIQSLMRRTVYILIPFSLLMIKYFPEFGVVYGRWTGEIMWVGVTLQKNGLGRLCLICAFFLTWTLWRRWQGQDAAVGKSQTATDVILLGLSVWLLKGPTLQAYSATAVTSLCLGLFTFGVLQWGGKHRASWALGVWAPVVALLIAVGITLPVLGTDTAGDYVAALGRDATLTGRTDIWAGLLPVVEKQPLLGYGFGSFWTSEAMEEHTVGEAHNGYLDVRLELGIVGLFLLTMFLLTTCHRARLALSRSFGLACMTICYVVMSVVHNISESSINSLTSHLTEVVVFLSVSLTATAAQEGNHGAPARVAGNRENQRE